MNQREVVAAHLRQHGGITEHNARNRMGIRDVRKPIYLLRRQGWSIETCTDRSHNCIGLGHYVLQQEPGQPPVQPALGLA